MEKQAATLIFESLSSGLRLDVFRLLVKKGPEGMVAGEIATALDVPPANLSFHLKALSQARLVIVEQQGRFQRYRPDIPLMLDLIAYLTEECCSGSPTQCVEMRTASKCVEELLPPLSPTPTNRGLEVHLTTSDPAAHLMETLNGTLAHLTVSRIDPHEVTEAYRAQVLATKGAKLDAAGRAVLEEDLRSPCTEEIAVFQAFSRVIREAGKKFVVMDTAPTGHTLLLLDATGAYHRDIARQMGEGAHFITPMMQLQDPKQTKVLLVTLAETTPVLEAANLQADLRRAGIEPWAWVINNSIAAGTVTSPLLKARARNEVAEIEAVATRHATRYALVPLLKDEPIGAERLRALIHPQA